MTCLWDCSIASHTIKKSFSGFNQEYDQMQSCDATPDSKHFTKLLPLSLKRVFFHFLPQPFALSFPEECFDLAFDSFGIMI